MNVVNRSGINHLYNKAGWLLAASGFLFLLSFLISGFSQQANCLIVPGILSAVAAWGLMKNIHWVAYPAFLVALFGSLFAYANMGGPFISNWWLGIIAMAQLVAALSLFIHIWQR